MTSAERTFENGIADDSIPRTGSRLSSIAITLSMTASYLLLAVWSWSYTMDDAYISFRYAKHIGDGIGPIWNLVDNVRPVEGFTSFLHVWLLGGFRFLTGAEPVLVGKMLGVIAVLVLTGSVVRESERQELGPKHLAIGLSFLILPFTALNSVSGMETTLFMALNWLCTIACIRLLEVPTSRRTWVFVLLGLLGTLTRPEFGLPFGLMAAYLWWRCPAIRMTLLKAIAACYVLPGLIITGWRFYYYGDLFPNPFYIKQAKGLNQYGLIAVARFIGLCALPYLILIASGWRRLWLVHRNLVTVIVLNVGATCLYFCTTKPLMNWWFRFLLPQVPLLAFCAAMALKARTTTPATKRLKVLRAAAVMLLLVIAVSPVPIINGFLRFHSASEARYREVGRKLAPFAAGDRWMTFYDVGSIPYESEWNTVDSVGLNTHRSNLRSLCLMKTDIVIRFSRSQDDIPQPCSGLYVPAATLPFFKRGSELERSMHIFVRNDVTYTSELRESLLKGWPEPLTRPTNWVTWYQDRLGAYIGKDAP